MNARELQMAWIAAKEAGNRPSQRQLLADYPAQEEALVDFIAAYHAIGQEEHEEEHTPLLALTQRACQNALTRVFGVQAAFANLSELRKHWQLSKVETAKRLRLGLDVWNKLEEGAIELLSLSQHQLQLLSLFFQISAEQFGTLLRASQPSVSFNRRQTLEAAGQQQGPRKQTFAEAIQHSTMTKEEQKLWLA